MKGMGNIMKQAQKMQAKMMKIQEELAEKTVEASVGGGMVKVVASGKQEIMAIEIEKEVVDPEESDMLQDLIVAAVNDGQQRAQDLATEKHQEMLGPFAGMFGDLPMG